MHLVTQWAPPVERHRLKDTLRGDGEHCFALGPVYFCAAHTFACAFSTAVPSSHAHNPTSPVFEHGSSSNNIQELKMISAAYSRRCIVDQESMNVLSVDQTHLVRIVRAQDAMIA
ncbi:hypothetical protein CPC08DRAFT_246760 [Agrocybe pediades]|nr:hypothetical protein CPC08DRAFT_246760 [Agrocybe pediades]